MFRHIAWISLSTGLVLISMKPIISLRRLSGCTNDGVIMRNKHVSMATLSYDSLQQEIARGKGEHLASLATLLGVREEDQPVRSMGPSGPKVYAG